MGVSKKPLELLNFIILSFSKTFLKVLSVSLFCFFLVGQVTTWLFVPKLDKFAHKLESALIALHAIAVIGVEPPVKYSFV